MPNIARRPLHVLLLTAALCSVAVGAEAPRFRLVDLLPEPASDRFPQSWAIDINNRGEVVGSRFADSYESEWMPWFRAPGGPLIDFTTPGAFPFFERARPVALNNRGAVVGQSYNDTTGFDRFSGFSWQAGHLAALPSLPDGPRHFNVAWDINDRGVMVGALSRCLPGSTGADCEDFDVKPGLWDRSGPRELETMPGYEHGVAAAVNNRGQVVGHVDGPAGSSYFLWEHGSMRALDVAPGTGGILGFNDAGQMLLRATGPHTRSFLWQDGQLTELRPPPGFASVHAMDLNENGQVVGLLLGEPGQRNDNFLYTAGRMLVLSELLEPAADGRFDTAYGLNDHGQIVGIGTFQGREHGVLLNPLSPIPEPGTTLLWLAGLATIALKAKPRGADRARQRGALQPPR